MRRMSEEYVGLVDPRPVFSRRDEPSTPSTPATPTLAGGREAGGRRLPMWWLFTIGLWAPPQQVFWSLIQSILVPATVATLVGDSQKQVALGYIATATQLGACWGPCIGTWSDRCSSPCGRRRPFMLTGSVTFCFALFVMRQAPNLESFAAGTFLFSFTAAICCAPFGAVLPEIVPAHQRRSPAPSPTHSTLPVPNPPR